MNILYISSKKNWGGVFSWMQKTALALEQKRHAVYILSHPRSKFNQNSDKRLKIIAFKLGMEYSPITILYLVYFIKKKKINLVVTNLEKEVGIGGIAAKLCKIPNIRRVGREDDFNNSFKNKWNHTHLVTKSIVPCNYITNTIVRRALWLKTDNFFTIYNGRNVNMFDKDLINDKRASWGVTGDKMIIGITSQLLPVKQVDLLIKIFSKLTNNFKDIVLVITGLGRDTDKLKQYSLSFNLLKRIIFTGFTEEPILTAACYDIAVLNSRLEGFPNTVVEYFAAGTPVVSTDVGGVNEIIKDGYNGSLVKIGDEKDLYDKLELLIKDENLRNKYATNATKTISEKFSENIMINTLESFFDQTIVNYND